VSLIMPGYIQRDPDYYVTDFSEYTVGAAPPDWTSRQVAGDFSVAVQSVAGSLSGKALRWTKTVATRHGLSWDKVPPSPDAEILVRTRMIEAGSNGQILMCPWVRGAGGAGTETGYRFTTGIITTSSLYYDQMFSFVSGTATSFTTQVSPAGGTLTTNAWYWIRARAIGNSFSVKAWLAVNSEPGSWDSTATNSAISAGGWVGLHDSSSNPDMEVDFYSVALNGKTAPSVRR